MKAVHKIIILFFLAVIPSQAIGINSFLNPKPCVDAKNPSQANELHPQKMTQNNANAFDRTKFPSGTYCLASNDKASGILDPIPVEQTGFSICSHSDARTDTGAFVKDNISLDSENDWIGCEADASVWNLHRLYAINGSFDNGIPGQNVNPSGAVSYYPYGWDATSENGSDEETQIASYDISGSKYVVVENQGHKQGPTSARHYAGTQILWNQTIQNTPYCENFTLRFRYLYLRGPLGATAPNNCSITVFVNESRIWNTSLQTLDSRGTWYDTGEIDVNLSGIESAFEFKIGLVIENTIQLSADSDYDSDGYPDGIDNTVYITVYFDDVSFIGTKPPSFEEVELEFMAGNETVPVLGNSGVGNAKIVNESYWRDGPVPIELTSNVSVSFGYQSQLCCHRFLNSSWTTDPIKTGVQYSSDLGANPELSTYTYVGTLGALEHFGVNISYPDDWSNVTIYDPFLNNVTSQCSLYENTINIPESLLDRLGWWNIRLHSQNYAKSIVTQKYNLETGRWINESIYRTGNISRISVSIGTLESVPILSEPMNVTWILPNDTIWSFESVLGGDNGEINSSELVLGPLNTSAGKWSVIIYWTNGTEVAYGKTEFELHHSSCVSLLESEIDTFVGEVITCILYFLDDENGNYLTDETATIVGNWSGPNVIFTPNLQRNWWEGEFDTDLTGGGRFLVVVNASKPYFDNITCQFIVNCKYSTELKTTENITDVNIDYQETYELILFYTRKDTGENITSAYFDVSNSFEGLNWTFHEDNGSYRLVFRPWLIDLWELLITATKDDYQNATIKVTINSNIIKTSISGVQLQNVIFCRNCTFTYEFLMINQTGVVGASITATRDGTVCVIEDEDLGNGTYKIVLNPRCLGDHRISFTFEKYGFESQISTLLFFVDKIPMKIIPEVDPDGIEGNSTTFSIKIVEVDIDGEQLVTCVNVTYEVVRLDDNELYTNGIMEESSSGIYTGTFEMPAANGVWEVRIFAEKMNYTLEDEFTIKFTPRSVESDVIWTWLQDNMLPISLFLLIGLVTISGKRRYSSMKKERVLMYLKAKNQLGDAKNIISVLILQRDAGLPIYSKILKGGFEEAMLSGFISAISSFRSEIEHEEKLWVAIPISDLISAVRTHNLICALITMSTPSSSQVENLEMFARAVGSLYDDRFDMIRNVSNELRAEVMATVESIFYEIMSENLLRKLIWSPDAKFSRRFQAVKSAISRFSNEPVLPEELVETMVLNGIDEGKACFLVIEAINTQLLMVTNDNHTG